MTRRLVMMMLVVLTSGWAVEAQNSRRVGAALEPIQEVPAVSSDASGRFSAVINTEMEEVTYELSFEDLQGAVTQSHIHIAQPGVNGGIMVWLCKTASTAGNAPAGTPDCPSPGGTVTGVITPSSVTAMAAPQGVAAGEFDEFIRAIRNGVAYANVHSSMFPGGEIRGQIRPGTGN